MLCYFSILINMPFLFSRRFILTVTVFTVLFTAWYMPNCFFTYLCSHYLKKKKLTCILIITLNAAILCCKAPRTACWVWRSINKIIIIIIIIIIILMQNQGEIRFNKHLTRNYTRAYTIKVSVSKENSEVNHSPVSAYSLNRAAYSKHHRA